MTRFAALTIVGVTMVISLVFMFVSDVEQMEKLIVFFLANLIAVIFFGFEGIIDAMKDKPRS